MEVFLVNISVQTINKHVLYFVQKQYFCLKAHINFILIKQQYRNLAKSCFSDFHFLCSGSLM